MYNSSVCLERKFTELGKLTEEQLEKEALEVLNSVGYAPLEINFGVPNKGVIGEIRIPVLFNKKLAIDNWHK